MNFVLEWKIGKASRSFLKLNYDARNIPDVFVEDNIVYPVQNVSGYQRRHFAESTVARIAVTTGYGSGVDLQIVSDSPVVFLLLPTFKIFLIQLLA